MNPCGTTRLRCVGAALLAFGLLAPAAHAVHGRGATELYVERFDDEIVVHAQADVDADRTVTWATLTDYDRLAEFIPGMVASRTVSRNGDDAVIEQKGSMGFWPFRRSFVVLFAVREVKPRAIAVRGIGGDIVRFDARYDVVPLDARHTRIVYRANFVPQKALPPLVGLPMMRSTIRTQFDALVDEVQRRAAPAS